MGQIVFERASAPRLSRISCSVTAPGKFRRRTDYQEHQPVGWPSRAEPVNGWRPRLPDRAQWVGRQCPMKYRQANRFQYERRVETRPIAVAHRLKATSAGSGDFQRAEVLLLERNPASRASVSDVAQHAEHIAGKVARRFGMACRCWHRWRSIGPGGWRRKRSWPA